MKSLILVPTMVLAMAQSAGFSGTWERNAKLSQNPFEKIELAFGSGQVSGSGGREYDVFSRTGLLKDVNRATLRQMLLDYASVVERIEVELEGEEMTVSVGNNDYFSLFYLDGQPHSRQIEEGLLLQATARQDGNNVHVEQKGEEGGVIKEVYSLLDGGKQLAVVFQIEHKAIDTPFVFRTVYDRVP